MTKWEIVGIVLFAIAAIGFGIAIYHPAISYDRFELAIVALVMFCLSIFVYECVLVGNAIDRRSGHNLCTRYAIEQNRETKFVNYTHWSRACLTRASDGRWINIDNLRDVTQSAGATEGS